ncbi:flavodoxin reductase [Leptospira tipperaryensis]|uniref:Flavodoxin reductase n=1 Tax=Leptospira tipperaryensis TaxID=2564040 RepID=A0A1D7V3V9_9LEPT|nr:FAD-dependent oxidoreductase [Leptospira tipperaryensis]AOP36526.1 flavodoxin reductase [Leptospira tipperaryensis]
MANPPKKIKIKNILHTSNVCTITFNSLNGPLNFIGGQYIILNSGLKSAEGKEFKRAYSVISSDVNQEEFDITFQVLYEGMVSKHLSRLNVGDELEFSGPWGKFLGNPEWPHPGKTLLVATDTGITAIQSILHSSGWKKRLSDTRVLWLFSEADKFIPISKILESIPNECGVFQTRIIPAINDFERMEKFEQILINTLDFYYIPENAFLAGDGRLLQITKEFLLNRGVLEDRIGVEAFFHSVKETKPVVS